MPSPSLLRPRDGIGTRFSHGVFQSRRLAHRCHHQSRSTENVRHPRRRKFAHRSTSIRLDHNGAFRSAGPELDWFTRRRVVRSLSTGEAASGSTWRGIDESYAMGICRCAWSVVPRPFSPEQQCAQAINQELPLRNLLSIPFCHSPSRKGALSLRIVFDSDLFRKLVAIFDKLV